MRKLTLSQHERIESLSGHCAAVTVSHIHQSFYEETDVECIEKSVKSLCRCDKIYIGTCAVKYIETAVFRVG
jgi:hypothetical protein